MPQKGFLLGVISAFLGCPIVPTTSRTPNGPFEITSPLQNNIILGNSRFSATRPIHAHGGAHVEEHTRVQHKGCF